jgi:type III pantothenate kinase
VLFAIDLGNTNLTCGVFEGEALIASFRLNSDRALPMEAFATAFAERLTSNGVNISSISRSVVCSVVPQLTNVVVRAAETGVGGNAYLVGADWHVPVVNLCDAPAEVGKDRLVNAFAAHAHVKGAAIVVDMGTATKLDCVSAKGEFLGGAIAPGVKLGLDALAQHAAQLRLVELTAPPRALATNTLHAIQSGVVIGHAAMVDGMLQRLQRELGGSCPILVTGGFSVLIADHLTTRVEVDEHLTLRGLALLAKQH